MNNPTTMKKMKTRAPPTLRRATISDVSLPSLTRCASPWVAFTAAADPWVAAELTELRAQGGLVCVLDGRDLHGPAAVFRTFARELSFPDYFGHNWDALVDCLRDGHGHGHGHGQPYVAVLIEHADGLLGMDFLGVFISVLCQASWHANLRLDADGIPCEDEPPYALHFVLLLDRIPPAAFAKGVARGMDVGIDLTA